MAKLTAEDVALIALASRLLSVPITIRGGAPLQPPPEVIVPPQVGGTDSQSSGLRWRRTAGTVRVPGETPVTRRDDPATVR